MQCKVEADLGNCFFRMWPDGCLEQGLSGAAISLDIKRCACMQ